MVYQSKFNHYINVLPNNLIHLELGEYFFKKVNCLPCTINQIIIRKESQQNLFPINHHSKLKILLIDL